MNPWTLDYWQSGEYQVVREKLDAETQINPDRKNLFRALTLTPEKDVRVCIIGQDPYPDHHFATGVAFSIPASFPEREWPPTLKLFLQEYSRDLGYSLPVSGNLEAWASRGVLLWNAIPSCRQGSSLSHDWSGGEWNPLTREIITRLSVKGIVFAFLGSVAKRFIDAVDLTTSEVIITSHPSPRGSLNSRTPFVGSRLFSCINDKLISQGLDPVDWRLDGSVSGQNLSRTAVGGSRVLPNLTGAELPGLKGKAVPNLATPSFEL